MLASEDDERPADRGNDGADDVPSPRAPAQEGARGEALTDLRPAGVARFAGQRVDVVTEGDYIAAGQQVEVIRAERYRRVVRLAPDLPEVATSRGQDGPPDGGEDRPPEH